MITSCFGKWETFLSKSFITTVKNCQYTNMIPTSLQDLANEYNLQIILAGGTPEEELQINDQQPLLKPLAQQKKINVKGGKGKECEGEAEKKPIKQICPECPNTQKRLEAK